MNSEVGEVFYEYGSGLYANITNRCPCRCEFCIRGMTDGLGTADSLWLKREPSAEEILLMLKEWNLSRYEELVFCGYGEPTERLDDLLSISRWVKENTGLRIRINTNGLADLIYEEETAPMLEGLVDVVSVSLNQCTAEKYDRLCHPRFGEKAFPAILHYTRDVQQYVSDVIMSVVNVIPEEDIASCRRIAAELGVPLRVR
ncbi:MAG: TIGR04100 family radical SAM protein [Anaerovoracaceae bacterium]